MSNTVESTVVTDETPVETSEKKFNFTRKQLTIAAAALTGTAAVIVIALKVKNGDFADVSVEELVADATDAAVKN